ncbi:MAG: SgcJ/EcaC family oxidoreductase [Myxococcota bacterium]
MSARWISAMLALSSLSAVAGEGWNLRVGASLEVEIPALAKANIGSMGDKPIADLAVVGNSRIKLTGVSEGDATLSVVYRSGEKASFPLRVFRRSEAEELTAYLARQAAAWSKGDLDGFCESYAPDAVFVSPSGVTKGRDQVLARYKKKYPDAKAMGTLALEPIDIRLSGEAATVAAKWTLTYPDKPPASGHTVVVFIRHNGRWRIVHDASM